MKVSRKCLLFSCLFWLIFLGLFMADIYAEYTFALTGSKVHRAIWGNDWLGSALFIDVLMFFVAVTALYLLAAVMCWAAAESARVMLRRPDSEAFRFVAAWAALWMATAGLAAAAEFPHSGAVGDYHALAMAGAGPLTLASLLLVGVVISLVPAGILLLRMLWRFPRVSLGAMALVFAVSGSGWALSAYDSGSGTAASTPNIIFIGVDSLRIDHLAAGGDGGHMPHLDALLEEMVIFHDTITPLPRTSPAWTSLLTGLYPARHGAAFNLSPPEAVDTRQSLARDFRARGYQTIYAADETRFSNKDAHYGFETLIAPRMGAGDFLFGVMADTPLVLLAMNSRVGQWLFPYLHANRAVAYSYRPGTFTRYLADELDHVDRPAFLVTHLCLAHWPYYWAESPLPDSRLSDSRLHASPEESLALYRRALRGVDGQLDDILADLRQRGWLDNALLMVVSDHGEGFGVAGESVRQHQRVSSGSWRHHSYYVAGVGHGTTLDAPSHYQVVFALQHFVDGEPRYMPRVRDERISLVDIRPTLDELLGLDASGHDYDGRSFVGLVEGDSVMAGEWHTRPVFIETGFNTPAMMAGIMDEEDIYSEGYVYYDVVPASGRLVIRPEKAHELVARKVFSVLRGEWQMTATPGQEGYRYRMIHRPDRRWANYPEVRGVIAPAPIEREMEAALSAYISQAWRRYREGFDNEQITPAGE